MSTKSITPYLFIWFLVQRLELEKNEEVVVGGSFENESDTNSTGTPKTIVPGQPLRREGSDLDKKKKPVSPAPAKQPGVTNILARTSSSSSTGSHASSQRQNSQSSLFDHFASQAKELVRETTRQSSQEGLLAHVDKADEKVLHSLEQ
uniref:Uncharacterized protein n=1 Tax=Megaselia scalaris TaxID=36166 RepID=T1GID5_MEGSC